MSNGTAAQGPSVVGWKNVTNRMMAVIRPLDLMSEVRKETSPPTYMLLRANVASKPILVLIET